MELPPPVSITVMPRRRVEQLGDGLRDYDAVVSINDSHESVPILANVAAHPNALILRFDDVFSGAEAAGLAAPTAEQVAAIVGFAEANLSCRLLAHCTAGISRSGAAACIIRAVWDLARLERIDPAGIAQLIGEHHLLPNPLMVQLAEDILGSATGLRAAVMQKAKQVWGLDDF